MSRLGKKPLFISPPTTVTVQDGLVSVSGAGGNISKPIPDKIDIKLSDNQMIITRLSNDKQTKSNHGTIWSHLNNMVKGVQTPWSKKLEIKGTGYKAEVSANILTVTAGFIHPIKITIPSGLTVNIVDETSITISGIDKELVGQFASTIRKIRPPEPYKGKGIRYTDEYIKLKPGKAAKTQ